eukprot:5314583-Lingulodinium_polyedra.AAC.1
MLQRKQYAAWACRDSATQTTYTWRAGLKRRPHFCRAPLEQNCRPLQNHRTLPPKILVAPKQMPPVRNTF